ncbi:putative oxidoreductase component of anaerobic dehydrogenases [Vibrio maritimus]|uniref:Putative oxidoreductase component of anaerobic dehydrogenases n=1 Tax=Vibrio maritimus TaxID=990268 RepID=A0A090S3M5_9VIBR|nr:putative oxidoreductase component of anaerobic dehydrogenases [Vibrio maritimus]
MSQSDVIDLQSLQTMAKVFGSLLYFPLTDSNNQTLIQALSQDVALADSDIQAWCNTVQSELPDSLNQDFFLLFEGGEVMLAPPWGSVYTDKEEVIFGDSTVAYRQFLRQHDIELDTGMREPEDQIGLMLFAVSQLIEQQQDIDTVKALFAEHLLTWCYRYFELVQEHARTKSYQQLASLVSQWCEAVQELLELTPKAMKLYR